MEKQNTHQNPKRVLPGMGRRGNVIYVDFGAKPKTPVTPDTEQNPAVNTDTAEIINYVEAKIVIAGHPANDPVFWKCAEHTPITSRKGKNNTLDTQIGWALSHTRRFYGNIRQERRAAQ